MYSVPVQYEHGYLATLCTYLGTYLTCVVQGLPDLASVEIAKMEVTVRSTLADVKIDQLLTT
jgi:hypothetical protein